MKGLSSAVRQSHITASSANNANLASRTPRRDSQTGDLENSPRKFPFGLNSTKQNPSQNRQWNNNRTQRTAGGQREGANDWAGQRQPQKQGAEGQQRQSRRRDDERRSDMQGRRQDTKRETERVKRTDARQEIKADKREMKREDKQEPKQVEFSAESIQSAIQMVLKDEPERGTMDIQLTNLEELFGPPPPSQDLTLSYTSTSEARIQNFLEQNAGDYSRYFPQVSNSLQRIPDPVQTAQLTLARKRDMGLKVKQKALGIVSQLARTSTGPTTKLVT